MKSVARASRSAGAGVGRVYVATKRLAGSSQMSAIATSPALVREQPAPLDQIPSGSSDRPAPEGAARRSMEIITLGWLFGSVWNTATTGSPATVFLKELDASPFQFGVVAALPFIASLLSLPASLLIERTGA